MAVNRHPPATLASLEQSPRRGNVPPQAARRQTRDIMGMPVAVEVVGNEGDAAEKIFGLFRSVDSIFSTYKAGSEISRINRGELSAAECGEEVREVLRLAEETRRATNGYFDIRKPDGTLDPSGLVKGWAIERAARLLQAVGFRDFYVEAGGDIQTSGRNAEGKKWRIGIRDPEAHEKIVKIIEPRGRGVATSGTAARGAHIWDPHTGNPAVSPYFSITVIGPDAYEADRFATAAFAMGERAMDFLEALPDFEAYAIGRDGISTKTSGFKKYEADR